MYISRAVIVIGIFLVLLSHSRKLSGLVPSMRSLDMQVWSIRNSKLPTNMHVFVCLLSDVLVTSRGSFHRVTLQPDDSSQPTPFL